MPADTLTETVTLDRQAVMDLLVEAHAVADVFEALSGVSPTTLTEELIERVERIAHALFGDFDGVANDGNLDWGPRVDLWKAGERRADELLGRPQEATPRS